MKRLSPSATVEERIAARTVVDDNGCWLWQGYLMPNGYAFVTVRGKRSYAHRLSYITFVGPIPDGLVMDHLCRVRHCVNPEHLEPVTIGENVRRGAPATKSHCVNGHPRDEMHMAWFSERGRLRRRCQVCAREAVRRCLERKRARQAGAA